jgi:hypothetical protein
MRAAELRRASGIRLVAPSGTHLLVREGGRFAEVAERGAALAQQLR